MSFKKLKVYQKAYELAMDVFEASKSFPKEETYSLTDQMRRASRSICSNIAEAYRERTYPKFFASKIKGADAETSEMLVWIDFAEDCGYISDEVHQSLTERYKEVGKMLGSMASHPERFVPKEVVSRQQEAVASQVKRE